MRTNRRQKNEDWQASMGWFAVALACSSISRRLSASVFSWTLIGVAIVCFTIGMARYLQRRRRRKRAERHTQTAGDTEEPARQRRPAQPPPNL